MSSARGAGGGLDGGLEVVVEIDRRPLAHVPHSPRRPHVTTLAAKYHNPAAARSNSASRVPGYSSSAEEVSLWSGNRASAAPLSWRCCLTAGRLLRLRRSTRGLHGPGRRRSPRGGQFGSAGGRYGPGLAPRCSRVRPGGDAPRRSSALELSVCLVPESCRTRSPGEQGSDIRKPGQRVAGLAGCRGAGSLVARHRALSRPQSGISTASTGSVSNSGANADFGGRARCTQISVLRS
jgi:hypothetical protein